MGGMEDGPEPGAPGGGEVMVRPGGGSQGGGVRNGINVTRGGEDMLQGGPIPVRGRESRLDDPTLVVSDGAGCKRGVPAP